MKITGIKGVNVKGLSFDFKLSGATVVCGDNFSGKTAVLDAVRLGLAGYLPRLGKQPGSTRKLATEGKAMEVTLDTDTTTAFQAWRVNGTGASYEGSLPWQVPITMLDTREFFQLSYAARIQYIFRISDLKASGYRDEEFLESIKSIEIIPTKVSGPIIAAEAKALEASIAGRKATIADWLDEYLESVKRRQKECSAAVKAVEAYALARKGKSLGSIGPDRSAEIATKLKARDDLAAEVAALKKEYDKESAKRLRKQEIEEELKSLPTDWKEIEVIKKELETLKPDTASRFVIVAEDKRRTLKAAKETLADVLRIEELSSCGKTEWSCHNCGAPINPAFLQNEIKRLQSNVLEAEREVSEAEAAEATAKAAIAERCQKGLRLETKLSLLRKQQALLNRLRGELAGLSVCECEPVNTAALDAQLRVMSEELAQLQKLQQEREVRLLEVKQAEQSEKDSASKSIELEVLKAISKATIAFQEQAVDRAFGCLLEETRLCTDGILKTPLAYRKGELGRIDDGRFISWEVFSGTEEAVAAAGLSTALARQSPFKVVIIDELGRLTAENKVKLLARMSKLVAEGIIDNFIGADVPSPVLEQPGIQIIRV